MTGDGAVPAWRHGDWYSNSSNDDDAVVVVVTPTADTVDHGQPHLQNTA